MPWAGMRASALVFVLLWATPVTPAEPPRQTAETARLRTDNQRIREALDWAIERSQTFRQLTALVEGADYIVYVDEGRCRGLEARSCVTLLPTPGQPRLLVRLNSRQPLLSVVAQLAHELQHVVEIARDTRVRNEQALRALYERIGFSNCNGRAECWETRAAQDVESRVWQEATSGTRGQAAAMDAMSRATSGSPGRAGLKVGESR